ncbi:MAG: cytochrome P450 [Phenylobacterium sp.]|uniref:cytochrome P450 n=1 Tax=Phenylobacterium sp. TaxID=1871053 RepID=UPI002718FD5B|nr:cytochrome P450 [Phenylobacterium sp.]MDO8913754.1 cytochrome P450 [Phenylobacterium sp.]MDP2011600.1 cytochrome P450 [Phenylobacterium sp.]MDP3100637.1 cytochrome P450 [Phenylobacterium sp.]MDP3633251.1 cytochrome P450 [Phenylobacterium sp.]MDP3869824.1 cytochrome P450 [Phenylobacterium sp.]
MSESATLDAVKDARDAVYSLPIESLNVAQSKLFRDDAIWPYFERLRAEDPVHWQPASDFEPHWAVTRYNDIMAVDTNHAVFSSEGGISLGPSEEMIAKLVASGAQMTGGPFGGGAGPTMFIAMDPPKHDEQRKTVSPAVSPHNLKIMEPLIRERAGMILDSLPIGEPFDWVDKVSMELTAMTLATLFGMPQEDRRNLTRWSDMVMSRPGDGVVDTWEEKRAEMAAYAGYFLNLWADRKAKPPEGDLVSMLAHGEATKDMNQFEYLGNIILLTIGGNDTTRNTISGSIYALNKNPDQFAKLRANPDLIPSMVSETIRWQTPLAHMKRVATQDYELGGKTIKKGDNVVMWYVSGNRDDSVIENPNAFIIDRERPRQHLSFGFGVHRCVGNRLAELQLKIIWEEILARFPEIQVLEEPQRVPSTFVKGYKSMQVMIPRKL